MDNVTYRNEKIEVNCTECNVSFWARRVMTWASQRSNLGLAALKCGDCVNNARSVRSKLQVGKANGNWKNGATDAARKFYSSTEWKELRTKVFERDNYTCRDCNKHGGALEANHIKPRSKYLDLKLVASNIETLCKPCHDKKKWQVYK